MTKFDKFGFHYFGGYLTYQGKFVARFKYTRAPAGKATFLKQLKKRFTPETYFAALDAGVAPLQILINDDPKWWADLIQAQKVKWGTA